MSPVYDHKPNGKLQILRKYTCGCIVHHDQDGAEYEEWGLFCDFGLECKKTIEIDRDDMVKGQ
jgi:hypothetical protein